MLSYGFTMHQHRLELLPPPLERSAEGTSLCVHLVQSLLRLVWYMVLLLQDFPMVFRRFFQNCDVVSVVAGVRELSEQQDSSLVIKKLEPHFSCAHTSPQLCALSGFLS